MSREEDDDIKKVLAELEGENYIELYGFEEYRWAHDTVQEAALLLGSSASESCFQFEIGTLLYHNLDKAGLDTALFDVADLINSGNLSRRPEFAELHLKAAKKAQKLSAFHSAASYVTKGIKLFPGDPWNKEYRSLSLQLYTLVGANGACVWAS